jgi:hypothetical protein
MRYVISIIAPRLSTWDARIEAETYHNVAVMKYLWVVTNVAALTHCYAHQRRARSLNTRQVKRDYYHFLQYIAYMIM